MTNTPSPTDEDRELIEQAFALLCRKYVQRADERQKGMGLQYTEAETHDLAETIAKFTRDRLESLLSDRAKLEERIREIAATAWLMGTADTDAEWAAKILPDWRDTGHDGDCVGAPITCNRCVCDSALEAADQIIALNRSTDRAT